MSNAGQAVLSIVGGIVGFIYGGPMGAAYGFQLGYLGGTALFPTQLPHLQGPRLGEGAQTSAVVGTPIPMVFGTQRVGGTIIWASPIREVAHTEEVGGKGGPEQSQTTYRYFRSFAILLCEGPIGGIRRIWANGKLVYNRAAPNIDPEEDPDSFAAAIMQNVAVNSQLANKMTVYLGTEDQEPDPTIESFEGVGNVPAFRGYAYVVFHDVELKPEDGHRIPAQWGFEVYEIGSVSDGEIIQYSNEVLYPWEQATLDPRNFQNKHIYEPIGLSNPIDGPGGVDPGPFDSLNDALQEFCNAFNTQYRDPGGHSRLNPEDLQIVAHGRVDDEFVFPVHSGSIGNRVAVRLRLNELPPSGWEENGPSGGAAAWLSYIKTHENIWILNTGVGSGVSFTAPDANMNMFNHPTIPTCRETNFTDGETEVFRTRDVLVNVRRVTQPPPDPCSGGELMEFPGFCIFNGQLVRAGEWTYDESTTYRVLQTYGTFDANDPKVRYPLNPVRPLGHPQYDDQEFWEEAYAIEVARGRMNAGLTYGVHYPVTQNWAYVKTNDYDTVDVVPTTLASIVQRICARVGAHDVDVGDLEEILVHGYTVTRPMAARGAIEALRPYGAFDVVESSIFLKFPTRGKAAVATLHADDLGAHFDGEDRPTAMQTRKAQERELPRQIRVRYQNIERDYDPGEELSPVRVDTQAESVTDIEVPVAMSPTRAAQIAEIILRDTWAARSTHQTQVDQTWAAIEPADVIIIPVDDRTQRVRVTGIVDKLPNLRVLELVRDDDGSYVSHALGTEPIRHTPVVTFNSPAELLLLDLPALRDEDNNAGVYAAMWPRIADATFRGGTIYRSTDGGTSYTALLTVTSAATVGTLINPLPSGPSTIWDEKNELLVEIEHGELESRTESAVLAGANSAAIGDDGRWMIVQFRNAENIAGNVWRLTGLLQGRRGTEHNIGRSIAGDRFVLISGGGIARLTMNVAEVNVPRLYKGVAVGMSVAATGEQSFTGRGVALKPFSPVHIKGVREGNDLRISWVRRDRMQIDYVAGAATLMSEDYEDYEVDILDDNGHVVRTLSVSEQEALYTEEQQITDFGAAQPAVTVRIYQISVAVGRGYPGEATL